MAKNKPEIIKCESSNKKCYICDGTGEIKTNGKFTIPCKFCEGSGTFEDNHYILVVNGMAFHMDTLK